MPINWAFLMFGGRPFQLGWCNGHNTRLNCPEYHRASEFNPGARDFILLVAHRWEIEDGKLDTACVKAFHVPAGKVVEVFNTTPTTRPAWSTTAASSDGGAAGGHQWPAPRGCSRHACRR